MKNGINEEAKKEYEEYVKQVTPLANLPLAMLRAFVAGGLICMLGQAIRNRALAMGLDDQTAGTWCSILLVLCSALLTGPGWYQRLARWGGAGTLVPITGFANSVAASAVEFGAEGQVFGVGCKIFNIAGPVILYGTLASWVLGLLYWAMQRIPVGIL